MKVRSLRYHHIKALELILNWHESRPLRYGEEVLREFIDEWNEGEKTRINWFLRLMDSQELTLDDTNRSSEGGKRGKGLKWKCDNSIEKTPVIKSIPGIQSRLIQFEYRFCSPRRASPGRWQRWFRWPGATARTLGSRWPARRQPAASLAAASIQDSAHPTQRPIRTSQGNPHSSRASRSAL